MLQTVPQCPGRCFTWPIVLQQFQGGGGDDRWLRSVRCQCQQRPIGCEITLACTCQDFTVVRRSGIRPIPFRNGIGCPLCGLVAMALVTGIGDIQLHRQVRARNPEAVIAPGIHHHVGLRWHVAIDALHRLRVWRIR